ncbi:hypothetical protein AMECASPLE_033541 [Ameca splendens]|uniref:KIAA0319-like C-terminal domain-containing protein n=1 Tax=Ameca splendens TaxID=208324 RepID=A0ABV0ZGS6_9TELE
MFCSSTVLQFSVQGPSGPLSASSLVVLLKKQLLQEKSNFLLFKVLRVDTVGKLLTDPSVIKFSGTETLGPSEQSGPSEPSGTFVLIEVNSPLGTWVGLDDFTCWITLIGSSVY